MNLTAVGDLLAPINAELNFVSFALLVTGLAQVRRRNLHRHRQAMTAALWTSALFLLFYLTRIALTGTHRFAGTGIAKTAYLGILYLPHGARGCGRAARDPADLADPPPAFPAPRPLGPVDLPHLALRVRHRIVVYLLLYQVYGYL